MITHSDLDENCMYGSVIDACKECVDNTMLNDCELCYECIACQKCYQAIYSVDCANCRNIYFSKNCVDCSDCFGCVNLRSKKYHIFNEPYTKGEYEKKIETFKLDSYKSLQEMHKKAFGFWREFPQKYMHERQNKDVSGDYIYNSKNAHDSFIASDLEDSRFCTFITHGAKSANCYDFTHYGLSAELFY